MCVTVIGIGVLSTVAWGCSDAQRTAATLIRRGDLAGAEAIYRELVATDQTDAKALNGLAMTLMLEHKYVEALPFQERVIAADPKDVQTRVELGFNYLNHQNRPNDAVRVLKEAAALDGSAKNLTFLAQAQAAAGKTDEAEQSLRLALKADPKYAYSYTVLIGLLEKNLRTAEAAEVRDLAASHGVQVKAEQPSQ
jgi:tetratricopeptide (TPR) repeat protein